MSKWSIVNIKQVTEQDGTLFVMENEKEIPFEIKRVFLVAKVTPGKTRGDHATKQTRLVLFPVSGTCKVVVDDGQYRESFVMDDPAKGLLIEPMVWRSMQEFTSDCVMMAVCDRPFTPGNETINDYQEYLLALRE